MKRFLPHIEQYRSLTIGFLSVLAIAVFGELFTNPLHFSIGVLLFVAGYWCAKKVVHHFHFDHHHAGDSIVDSVPVVTLILANILHPAVDGLSWYETISSRGIFAGVVFGLSIILHEILRQGALVAVFKDMKIKGYIVVLTALLGIAIGITTGIFNASFFHEYEYLADFATLFAYAFVISEFFLGHRHEEAASKNKYTGMIAGFVIGIVFIWFTKSM